MTDLDGIFGQDGAIETILRAYEADRLPHALIFAGAVGVGKATTARALAKLFLCEKPSKNRPCGQCPSCTLMDVVNPVSGDTNHPDYHVVFRQLVRFEKSKSAARDLAVDVIRSFLIEPASFKPSMNRGKVFVVEEAELMNASGQNALLKTLEEPFGRALIILLSDQPHALLPTVRSRCQIIPFAPLDSAVVVRELQKRGIDATTAQQAAELTDGSLGLALKWIEDGVIASAQALLKQIDALLSGRSGGDLAGAFKQAADAYVESQLKRDKQASKDQCTRDGVSLYLRIAANRCRQRLHAAGDEPEVERACEGVELLVKSERDLDANVNIGLVLQRLGAEFGQTLTAV